MDDEFVAQSLINLSARLWVAEAVLASFVGRNVDPDEFDRYAEKLIPQVEAGDFSEPMKARAKRAIQEWQREVRAKSNE